MSLGKLGLSILIFSMVACGGQYEAPHEKTATDVNQQNGQPIEGLARVDCNLELETTKGQLIRLFGTSKVFEYNESAGSDWLSSSVVFPLTPYSLLARFSKTSLKTGVEGPSFYVILCTGALNLQSECTKDDIIKVEERIGVSSVSSSIQLSSSVQMQYEQYSVNKLTAVCFVKTEAAP